VHWFDSGRGHPAVHAESVRCAGSSLLRGACRSSARDRLTPFGGSGDWRTEARGSNPARWLSARPGGNRPIGEHGYVLFRLDEYARTEREFIHDAIHALARARGGIVAEIQMEPTDRLRTTRVTTDSGQAVRFEPFAVRSGFRLTWEAIETGDTDALLLTLVGAMQRYWLPAVERARSVFVVFAGGSWLV
jgi:hypothetical protein